MWNEGEAVLFKELQQEAESQLQDTLNAYFCLRFILETVLETIADF